MSFSLRRKRRLSLTLAAVLLASAMFTGCSSSRDLGEQDAPAVEVPSLSVGFSANPGSSYTGTPAVPEYGVDPGLATLANKLQFTPR